jgi:hypothetical protein
LQADCLIAGKLGGDDLKYSHQDLGCPPYHPELFHGLVVSLYQCLDLYKNIHWDLGLRLTCGQAETIRFPDFWKLIESSTLKPLYSAHKSYCAKASHDSARGHIWLSNGCSALTLIIASWAPALFLSACMNSAL